MLCEMCTVDGALCLPGLVVQNNRWELRQLAVLLLLQVYLYYEISNYYQNHKRYVINMLSPNQHMWANALLPISTGFLVQITAHSLYMIAATYYRAIP